MDQSRPEAKLARRPTLREEIHTERVPVTTLRPQTETYTVRVPERVPEERTETYEVAAGPTPAPPGPSGPTS